MKNEEKRQNRQKMFVLTAALVCSLLCIGVILHEAPMADALLASPTMSVNPASQNVAQGATFTVAVRLNSDGISVRTAGFKLSFPSSFTYNSVTYGNLLGSSVVPGLFVTADTIQYGVSRLPGNTPAPVNGNLATISFTAPSTTGTYDLELFDVEVYDGTGALLTVGVTDGTVTVGEQPSDLEAVCNGPYSGYVGSSVSFTGSATGGTSPYNYAWDFDYDGTFNTQSTLQNPTHIYSTATIYQVALRVTDSAAATDICTTTVEITTQPTIPPPYVQVDPTADYIQPNETFCIDILVNSGTDQIRTVGIQLGYNSTWFSYQGLTYEDLLGTSVIPGGPYVTSGTVQYGVSRLPGNTPAPVNGKLATICFTVNPGTPTDVPFPFTLLTAELYDQNGDLVPGVTLVDGTRTIQSCANDPDVTNDGSVNVLDMILVGQHWGQTGDAGWIPEDINCDGIINVLDMIFIGQHWTG